MRFKLYKFISKAGIQTIKQVGWLHVIQNVVAKCLGVVIYTHSIHLMYLLVTILRWVFLLSALRGSVYATGRREHVVKEVLDLNLRDDVFKGSRADGKRNHTVIFARVQNGIDKLTSLLHEISNPFSSKYGQHLTRRAVSAITANPEASAAITAYLAGVGLVPTGVSKYGDFVTVEASVSTWEKLLLTEFYEFSHTGDYKTRTFIRSLNYSLPLHLHQHVYSVYNTVQLPVQQQDAPPELTPDDLHGADTGYITPALLKETYNIDSNKGNNLTSQAIYGGLYQSISPRDLIKFQTEFQLPSQVIAAAPHGHIGDTACDLGVFFCMEANLDAQYIMAIAQDVPTMYHYWSGGDVWVDWIMNVADMDHPPAVFSISYGTAEHTMSQSHLGGFNVEAIKLGVMGTTLLAASGDDGVADRLFPMGPKVCRYRPLFPASSPYVTAVGGTMVISAFCSVSYWLLR
jgi:tripeptidyl-peptidase-1